MAILEIYGDRGQRGWIIGMFRLSRALELTWLTRNIRHLRERIRTHRGVLGENKRPITSPDRNSYHNNDRL